MTFIDKYLNRITMYSLVLYGLSILAILSIVFSLFGRVPFKALNLGISLAILLLVSQGSNYLLAKLFKSPRNIESAYISGLILFFVLSPPFQLNDIYILIAAPLIAMLAKYLLAWKSKHIFNPVAIAALILDLFGNQSVIWWVSTAFMIIPVIILGFLILRKLRRFYLFFAFAGVSLLIIMVRNFIGLTDLSNVWYQIIFWGPLVFFGTVMLTEPLTTPPQKIMRIIYGAIVGMLFSLSFHFGPIYATPEFALVIGNIFSYIVSPKRKIWLRFISKEQLSRYIYGFTFKPDKIFSFRAGQYLEWTMSGVPYDIRGNRRYFTIASSPTESEVKLGVRIEPQNGSNFKESLFSLNTGDEIVASQLSGEFLLPDDSKKKLVFIAGGIGITPFRSMIKYLADKNDKRDIILLYAATNSEDFAYKEELEKLKEKAGVKTVYLVTNTGAEWSGRVGYITKEVLKEEVSDFLDRAFYLSGPNAMVENYKKMLIDLGVSRKDIMTDFFPGY